MNQNQNDKTLGVLPLAMFAVGTTLASGVFSLSGDFAAGGAHTLATLIGWAICGIGMFGLTMCFFKLSIVKKDLTSGIYTYARSGFGEYIGFNAAWGYWMSAILAQLAFITLFFETLGRLCRCFWKRNEFGFLRVGFCNHLGAFSFGFARCKSGRRGQCCHRNCQNRTDSVCRCRDHAWRRVQLGYFHAELCGNRRNVTVGAGEEYRICNGMDLYRHRRRSRDFRTGKDNEDLRTGDDHFLHVSFPTVFPDLVPVNGRSACGRTGGACEPVSRRRFGICQSAHGARRWYISLC